MTITHLTPKGLAERWNYSTSTLKQKRMDGSGPAYINFGRKILYPLVEVEKFEREHMRLAVSVPAASETT